MDIIKGIKNKDKQLDFYKDWSCMIIDFLAEHDENFKNHPTIGAEALKTNYIQAWEKKMLRGLKIGFNDINELAADLSDVEISNLNARLREKFGYDLNTIKLMDYDKLKRIMKRGYIRNEKELRLVDNWITEFDDRPDDDKELQLLQRMFSEFIDKLFDSANEKKGK